MGLYSSDIPAAPDYAAAQREGVEASAEVLPFQIAIDRAARMGTKYTDPTTGREYDFTGMGDASLNELDAASTERLMRSGADIQRNLTRDQYADLVDLMPRYNQLNLQSQRDTYDAALEASRKGTANTYDQNLEYMPRFGELQRSEDAKTFAQNLDLGETGTRRMTALQEELMPRVNQLGIDSQLTALRAGRAAEDELNPERAAMRRELGAKINEELAAGSDLTPLQRQKMEQTIRASQASRGNILGAGAGYDEGRLMTEAGENQKQQRYANALSFLTAPDLSPQIKAADAVNPLMPNYQSTGMINPNTPNFQATTTGGPNLNPVNIGQQGNMSYMQGTGQQGASYASNIWSQQAKMASEQVNPWMQGLQLAGSAVGVAGGLMAL